MTHANSLARRHRNANGLAILKGSRSAEVNIFSSLRHHVPSSEKHFEGDKWDMPEGTTVGQVLKMLNLPEREVRILLINGRHDDKERVLKEGDFSLVFPPMMGG